MKYELIYVRKLLGRYSAKVMGQTEKEIDLYCWYNYVDLQKTLNNVYGITLPNLNELKLYGTRGKGKSKEEFYVLPNQKKIFMGFARYEKWANDLFWEFNFFDRLTNDFISLRWQGYGDYFWWHNVANKKLAKTRTAENNKDYLIDFKTNKVWEILK